MAEQDVTRFVDAQDRGGSYEAALRELRAGRKTSHWMWWVFPQVADLGSSPTSQRFGVLGLEEARAYLAHPVLGSRLRECAEAMLAHGGSDAVAVLGPVDAMKLRSSMTLFAHAAEGEGTAPFTAVLDRFFGGEEDPHTLARL